MLYAVYTERMMIIDADTEAGAIYAARHCERESVRDYDCDVSHVAPITCLEDVPEEWRNALPYDGDGNTRIEQYFIDTYV